MEVEAPPDTPEPPAPLKTCKWRTVNATTPGGDRNGQGVPEEPVLGATAGLETFLQSTRHRRRQGCPQGQRAPVAIPESVFLPLLGAYRAVGTRVCMKKRGNPVAVPELPGQD